jgi:ring-1,2-phenylacetyl-CoA epoxidase subunit PaaD
MSILSSVSVESLVQSVADAVASVHDPEYPDVSIADLGLVESVTVSESGDVATIGLIPTFSGCPALDMIATDVEAAVLALTEVQQCNVEWLPGPVWTNERLTDRARTTLADELTVVLRRKDGGLRCPICGSDAVVDQSLAGPTRCRSVAWCDSCRNPVEVMR